MKTRFCINSNEIDYMYINPNTNGIKYKKFFIGTIYELTTIFSPEVCLAIFKGCNVVVNKNKKPWQFWKSDFVLESYIFKIIH